MPKDGHKHEAKYEEKHETREGGEDARQNRQDIKELFSELNAADEFYFADLNAINGSGVEGYAFITVERHGPGSADDVINVRMVAENLQAGLHIKHIHGFEGTPEEGKEAVTPTVAQHDTDGDGFVELAEGAPAYGPILLNLTPFDDFLSDNSTIVYNQSFHLPSGDKTHDDAAHSGDGIKSFNNLDLNHFVIHGLRVDPSVGAGTPGEVGVADTDVYKEVLPVSVGEIEQVSLGQAHQFLKQAYAEGFDFIV